MNDIRHDDPIEELPGKVEKKAARRLLARAHGQRSVWFGLGMFGLIGWAITIPTLLGIVAGIWLDRHWPVGTISWTLTLLFAGIILGCLNAWRWISRERQLDQRGDHKSSRESTSAKMPDRKKRANDQ